MIKALSDLAVDCTIILVGVSETVDKLIEDHASIGRAISQVKGERMKASELKKILETAEKALRLTYYRILKRQTPCQDLSDMGQPIEWRLYFAAS